MEYGDRRFEFEKPHEGLKGSLSSHPCFAPLAAATQPPLPLQLCQFSRHCRRREGGGGGGGEGGKEETKRNDERGKRR